MAENPFLLLLFLLSCLGGASLGQTDVSSCNFSDTLTGRDIIDRGVVERSADCLDSFLEVRMIPDDNFTGDSISLMISDMEGELYTFTDGDTYNRTLTFATRGPRVYLQGSGAWDLTLELAEVARTSCESGVAVTGNDTASLPGGECGGGGIGGIGGDDDAEVETNSRWHYDFQGSEAVQLFDVDFNLGRPSDAFLAFSTPNGRVAVLTGRSDQLRSTRLAVATSEGRSAADVIVQNTLEDTSAFYVDIRAYVGEGNFTTPEPTTTSTTVTPSLDEVMVFAMIVDEEEFYSSESGGLADLQQNIVDLAVDYVNPSLQPETCFLFSPAMTCRQRCYLTTSADRGCVYFSVDVRTSITCSYTNDLLRSDLSQEEMLDDWADEVDARSIEVDECLSKSETGWLVVVIGIPIAVTIVFVVGYIIAELVGRVRRKRSLKRRLSEGDPLTQDPRARDRRGPSSPWGTRPGARSGSGGHVNGGFDVGGGDGASDTHWSGAGASAGGPPPAYYDNYLEIMESDDE